MSGASDRRAQYPVHIVVVMGRAVIGEYRLDQPTIRVGRDPGLDVALDASSVSREHCRIRWLAAIDGYEGPRPNQWIVQDLGTANGTTVNGQPVEVGKLSAGDEIGVGRCVLLFEPKPTQLAKLERKRRLFSSHRQRQRPTDGISPVELARFRAERQRERGPHLKRFTDGEAHEHIPLLAQVTVLGASPAADVKLDGWLIKAKHAVIINDAGKFSIKRVGGGRPVRVNGKAVVEYDLKNSDSITIGGNAFRFFDALA